MLVIVSAIWQARAKTTGDFIGANFIGGLAGCVNEALFQVTVTDMFYVHQRSTLNGIYLTAVSFGNYMGPVAAGYVAESQGWRWVFYYLTIFMGVTTLAMIFCLEETKWAPATLNGRNQTSATTVSHEDPLGKTGEDRKDSTELGLAPQRTNTSIALDLNTPFKTYWQRHPLYTPDTDVSTRSFVRHMLQPFAILFTFPAVAFAALQYGWLVSMLSVLAVTQATIYPAPPYLFAPAAVGLMSLPPAIGAIIGSLLGGPLIDRFTLFVAKRRRGIHEPEVRLWFFLVPGFGLVVGALLYGLTIAKVWHL
jgi:MFS family permease